MSLNEQSRAPKDRAHRNGAHNIFIFLLVLFHPKCEFPKNISQRAAMSFKILPNKKRILNSVSCVITMKVQRWHRLFPALYHLSCLSFCFSAACCIRVKNTDAGSCKT